MTYGLWEAGDQHTHVPGGVLTLAADRDAGARETIEDRTGLTLPRDVVAARVTGGAALVTLSELDDEDLWVLVTYGPDLDVFAGDPTDFGDNALGWWQFVATPAELATTVTPARVGQLWLTAPPAVFEQFIAAARTRGQAGDALTAFELAACTQVAP